MEYKINQVPFKMEQIAEKLFNKEYLSDITFLVQGKKIFAHSLILMVRSSVFQEQLEITLGEKKIIPITDWGYNTFYRFIRFMYTDHVDDDAINFHVLLKLAKKYNVIRLVNHLLNIRCDHLEQLDFCVAETHKIGLNFTKLYVADCLEECLDSNEFLSIYPDTVEEILKLDKIGEGVKESDIIDAVIRWMNHHCKENKIQFSECRQKFANLIRNIRFPTMSNDELQNIRTKYPELLTKSDFMEIASLKSYGAEFDEGTWNSTQRMEYDLPYTWKQYSVHPVFETKFFVTSDLILGGIVFGTDYHSKYANITISCQQNDLDEVTQINIKDVQTNDGYYILNLGASIHIRPNFIYTIRYTIELDDVSVMECEPETEFIITAPPNTVNILTAHATMLGMCFFEPEDACKN